MMSDTIGRRLKLAALACLALPIVVLAAFAVGEVAARTISELQHVVQLLPAGLFIGMGTIPPSAVLTTGLLLFVSPLLADIVFVAAGRHEQATLVRDQGEA